MRLGQMMMERLPTVGKYSRMTQPIVSLYRSVSRKEDIPLGVLSEEIDAMTGTLDSAATDTVNASPRQLRDGYHLETQYSTGRTKEPSLTRPISSLDMKSPSVVASDLPDFGVDSRLLDDITNCFDNTFTDLRLDNIN